MKNLKTKKGVENKMKKNINIIWVAIIFLAIGLIAGILFANLNKTGDATKGVLSKDVKKIEFTSENELCATISDDVIMSPYYPSWYCEECPPRIPEATGWKCCGPTPGCCDRLKKTLEGSAPIWPN